MTLSQTQTPFIHNLGQEMAKQKYTPTLKFVYF
jgi:hypothetical protein